MPPSRHSGSSHSSHVSRVSHHSGSSHSSRVSRSYSSPSRHSSSSHSSLPKVSPYTGSTDAYGTVTVRPRNNQPSGYNRMKPVSKHYCRNHNYIYYPEEWTDAYGMTYYPGYYDEDGVRYESVVFERDGSFENVKCRCRFCDTESLVSFKSGDTKALSCPNCGGAMDVVSMLDTYTQDPNYTNRVSAGNEAGKTAIKALALVGLAYAGAFLLIAVLGAVMFFTAFSGAGGIRHDLVEDIPDPNDGRVSNVDMFGETIWLERDGEDAFRVSDGSLYKCEKWMTWDYTVGSYYDAASDCYLWYNTDVSPNLWQYWYEGISSEYSDYGWMEYEPSGWYIEVDEGRWEPYTGDISRLWHLTGYTMPSAGRADATEITDTFVYTNLVPGKAYMVKGSLIDKGTGLTIPMEDGSDEVAMHFISQGDGTVDIVFKACIPSGTGNVISVLQLYDGFGRLVAAEDNTFEVD